ncbi:alpha-1,6-mannosyl-glycoprotein 4-beta-N-acetylglucosaminyltransferase-like isoform X2 [Branchiostoma lanceolatum]|uniref:alpha-1,6-mannosyl-glycoprotein 4-beta-N-acetylglucosaminyltransferase-like isoform X2 n=1 Tax=Branchiostoma lanceolatum TaxID=7740 RepID=UPI00345344C6
MILRSDYSGYTDACTILHLPTLHTRRSNLTLNFATSLLSSELYRHFLPPLTRTTPPHVNPGRSDVVATESVRMAGSPRQNKGFLTIGIPTVKRDQNATYLVSTLDSLIEHTTAAEREQIVVVVFLADFDTDYNRNLSLEISRKYSQHLDNGFMQIIQAPRSFYPTLEGLKIKFKDSPERVRWRSKQCVDYAFLFQYCLNLSEYYLQLEDDVVSTQNFLTGIKEYLGRVKDDWTMLEFSELGFIGKLFRSSELQRFADFLLLFYQELPSDLLLHTFLHIMRPDMQPNAKKFIRKPSLFQHVGQHSSLAGKIQNLTDKAFVHPTARMNPLLRKVVDLIARKGKKR